MEITDHDLLYEFKKKGSKNKGIVAIKDLPPGMGVSSIKSLLSKYGMIDRVYLQAEEKEKTLGRKIKRGSASTMYKKGWIEFYDKKAAKRIVEQLHGKNMGSKKRDKYNDYFWNIRYVKGLTWNDVNEKISGSHTDNTLKKQQEMRNLKKQINFFKKNMVKSKRTSDKSEDQLEEVEKYYKQKEEVVVKNESKSKGVELLKKLFQSRIL